MKRNIRKKESKGPMPPFSKLPICLAIGCGIGLAFGSLALGVGIGIAIGITLDAFLRNRIVGKDKAVEDDCAKESPHR